MKTGPYTIYVVQCNEDNQVRIFADRFPARAAKRMRKSGTFSVLEVTNVKVFKVAMAPSGDPSASMVRQIRIRKD